MNATRPGLLFVISAVLFSIASPAGAFDAAHYVNNRTGKDTNDGKTDQTAFATIARAVSASKTSDTIVLANTGIPYHESIVMIKLGGTPQKPFVIEGNGAAISGLRKIRTEEWKPLGSDLYLLEGLKKTWGCAYLMNRGKKLPTKKTVERLKPGEFFWRKDKLYFKAAAGEQIASYDLAATALKSGLTVADASYITCRNLTCEYFANDGFNIHGDCRGLRLENVVARHNGDDGISIHAAGGIVVRNAHLHHNFNGIQDVDASRSSYHGVLAEHNRVGASFGGGFHALVDCVMRDNLKYQVEVRQWLPKYLTGWEHSPICTTTTVYMKNVVLWGSTAPTGLKVGKGTRAVVENCIISGMETGVSVEEAALCHLTASIIVNCGIAIDSASTDVFRDYNIYENARMKWLGKLYSKDAWDEFRKIAGHDANSSVQRVTIKEDGSVEYQQGSPPKKLRGKTGLTQSASFPLKTLKSARAKDTTRTDN